MWYKSELSLIVVVEILWAPSASGTSSPSHDEKGEAALHHRLTLYGEREKHHMALRGGGVAVLLSLLSLTRSVRAMSSVCPRKKVVIIGGGLQGCASAYYLREKEDVEVTIVERTGIAAAASGKGGGFLARDWGRGPTKALHEESFALHKELAEILGVSSYRGIRTLEVKGELGLREWPPRERTWQKKVKTSPLHPEWLDRSDTQTTLLDQNTAQVAPKELCEKLFEASGAHLVIGAARGLEIDNNKVVGVKVETGEKVEGEEETISTIDCDEVVVAAGAWSVLLEDWLPGFQLPMEGVYSSSMVYETDALKENPFALFCAEDSNDCHLEVYPRPDGSVYLCGIGGSDHVQGARLREGGDLQDATKMKANPSRIEAAINSIEKLAPSFVFAPAPQTAACMRPCARDALPVIGRLDAPHFPTNLALATGHNCWGILWAPITGKIVADIVLGHKSPVDISAFDPQRFMPKKPKRGRALGEAPLGEQW